MSRDDGKPVIDRPCPKCGNDKAFGPEYRRGLHGDEDLGEHLRYYCTRCRYMTSTPTQDSDTPQRRDELQAAIEARRANKRAEVQANRGVQGEPTPSQIEQVRRSETRGRWGWRG